MTLPDTSQNETAQPALREQLWVGPWRVVADLNQITDADGAIVRRLEPKAMAVLLHLASRPNEVASRDDLLAAAWPGLIVGDNALTQVVIKLRKALGDTAREPAFIEAIAKKGYRLIADVRRSATPPAAASAPVTPGPPQAPRRPQARRAVLGLAAGLLAGAAAWWWASAGGDPAASAAPVQLPADETLPTVGVNAFEDLAPQPQRSLLARALTADLVTDLSKVAALRVQSVDRADAAASSADRAQPRYLLSGSVQEDTARIRINVLLTEAATGRQLWSERFDRGAGDLFRVQDDLVKSILDVLPVKVSQAEASRIALRHTRNLQAWEAFMRAQAALLVRRPQQNAQARESYWTAIRLDPAFARAYAGVALTYALEYQQGWARDKEAALERALELAQASIDMSPDMPEANWVRGFVRTQRKQHAQALRDLDQALRLNPSYADAYALKAGIQTYIGQPDQAVPLLRSALRLNPDAGSLYFLLLGRAYYFLGDAEQARVNLNHALERNAESLEARLYLAATLALAGDREAALWQVNEIRNLEPGFNSAHWLATYPMTDATQLTQLQAAMAELRI